MQQSRFDPNARREPPPPEPVAIEIERMLLENYAGTYRLQDGRELEVVLKESGLSYSMDSIDWTPLHAEAKNRFFVEYEDQRFVFVTGGVGEAIRLDVLVEGQAIPLDRIED